MLFVLTPESYFSPRRLEPGFPHLPPTTYHLPYSAFIISLALTILAYRVPPVKRHRVGFRYLVRTYLRRMLPRDPSPVRREGSSAAGSMRN
jgi:hypothetical protein